MTVVREALASAAGYYWCGLVLLPHYTASLKDNTFRLLLTLTKFYTPMESANKFLSEISEADRHS